MKKIYLLLILLMSLFSSNSFAQLNVCFGATKNYSVDLPSGTTGSTYAWNVVETGFSGTIAGNPTLNGNSVTINWSTSPAGTYTVRVVETGANGCIGAPVTLSVTIIALPVIAAIPDVCVGNTTLLTNPGTPNATNPWSSSNTAVATVDSDGKVTGVSAGTATITFTNSNGCTDTEVVTILALPVTSTITSN
jgi:hypothetical protein